MLWDPVWLEDRWWVTSWCDEWLTMWWTDSWLSIAGTSCGLISVGAGEEQARKGHCRWGLQVWRRQVGSVRGTRWPFESSAGRMVARTTRWSHGRSLGWALKRRSSRDYVAAKSWVKINGGYTEFAGFPVVYQKTTGFLCWSTEPRPKTEDGGAAASGRWVPVWPVRTLVLHVSDDIVWRHRSGGHTSGSQGLHRG
jgi:hypothetical protein